MATTKAYELGQLAKDLSVDSSGNITINADLDVDYAGFDSDFSSKSTTDLSEGNNLYHTNTRVDTRINLQTGSNLDLSSKSTTDLSEGSNLYYTNARADARIAAADTGDLSEGSNLYYTDARADARIAAADTGDLSEGSNLYYTDARARGAVSLGTAGSQAYNSSTGAFTIPGTTDHITEGTNLFFTNARADARVNLQTGSNLDLSNKSTSDLSEGSNLYFTNARADARIAAADTGDLSEGSNLYYTNARADARINLQTGSNLDLSNKSTSDLSEGTNLYYTNARADARIAAASTTDLSEGTNLYYTTDRGDSDTGAYISGNRTYGNITTTGYIAGPATMTIDPAAVGDNTGTLVVAGNLQVDGTTTTINSTTVTVDDLNLTLASGAANAAAANGAGITVDGASATITYDATNDEWDFNKEINIPGGKVTGEIQFQGSSYRTDWLSVGHWNYRDNVEARFGNSDDLKIYHNSTNSFITNATGTLYINQNANDADVRIRTDNGSGSITEYIKAEGSTGEVQLYHYGAEKLATKSTGIDVTGNIVVSGTVDGRDVATDGTKLDGIETGATADQTAAQLLTAIKTVDGSGSGLDADTLDGSQASAFATSAQGTLADNALPKSGGTLTGTLTAPTLIAGAYGAGGSAGDGFRLNSTDLYGQIDASDKIRIAVNGNSFFNGGNVGIGTTSPSDVLEVSRTSTDQTAGLTLTNLQAGGYGSGIVWKSVRSDGGSVLTAAEIVVAGENAWNSDGNTASQMQFWTQKDNTLTKHMTLTKNGYLGIGTASPDRALHIEGSDFSSSSIRLKRTGGGSNNDAGLQFQSAAGANADTGMGGIWFQNSLDGNAYALIRARTDDATGTSGRLDFMTSTSVVSNSTSPSFTIKSSGNVGIGTDNPANNLTIYTTSSYGGMDIDNGSYRHTIGNRGNTVDIIANRDNDDAAGDIRFHVGGTGQEKMIIERSGDVGIGTLTPSNRLEIYKNNNGGALYINYQNNWSAASLSEFSNTPFVINTRGSGSQLRFSGGTNWVSTQAVSSDLSTAHDLMINPFGGNVGIGTTDPVKKLSIETYGDCGLSLRTTVANANAEMWEITAGANSSSNADLTFRSRNDDGTGGVEALRLKYGGKVGIGTTDPQGKLHVNGGPLLVGVSDDWHQSSSSPVGTTIIRGGYRTTTIQNDTTALKIYNAASNTNKTAGNYGNGIGFMHLDAETYGSGYTGQHAWIGLKIVDTPAQERSSLVFATNNNTTAGSHPTEKMVIRPDGTVGIGTMTPARTLDVAGNFRSTGSIEASNYNGTFKVASIGSESYDVNSRTTKASSGTVIYSAYPSGSNSPHNYDVAVQFPASGRAMEFSASWISSTAGPLYFRTLRDCCINWSSWSTISMSTVSDRRVKDNIVDYTSSEARTLIEQLQAVEYDYVNHDGTKGNVDLEDPDADLLPRPREIGYIAQDVEDVIPYAVDFNANGDTPNEHGWASAYTVNYERLVPVLTEALKDVYSKLDSLQTQLDNANQEIQRLRDG